jgi:hypothetical protein
METTTATEWRTFIAQRDFVLGSRDGHDGHRVLDGESLSFDGRLVRLPGGKVIEFPSLKGAIKIGWLTAPTKSRWEWIRCPAL